MQLVRFIKDKIIFIALNVSISAFSAFLLYMVEAKLFFMLFIPCIYIIGCVITLFIEFIIKNNFYKQLYNIIDNLDRKTLLSEIITQPDFYEGYILFDILKMQNKTMNDEIFKHSKAFIEYREYIELWVHEIKTPIAGAKLICENNNTTTILGSLQKIDSLVEQALFYCRSNHVEKDFFIKKLLIREIINNILRKNSKYLINNKISIEAIELDITVFTDSKWLEFILQQLIDNAVKYEAKKLKIYTTTKQNSVSLFICDDGIGIPKQDINRVFDKGFTGENGRKYAKSTGIGLYLCKKLCKKLDLYIQLTSEQNKGTNIEIIFPKSDMYI